MPGVSLLAPPPLPLSLWPSNCRGKALLGLACPSCGLSRREATGRYHHHHCWYLLAGILAVSGNLGEWGPGSDPRQSCRPPFQRNALKAAYKNAKQNCNSILILIRLLIIIAKNSICFTISKSSRWNQYMREVITFQNKSKKKQKLFTWIYLPVISHPIGIHNGLEAFGESVCSVKGRRRHLGLYSGQDRVDHRATPFLQSDGNHLSYTIIHPI